MTATPPVLLGFYCVGFAIDVSHSTPILVHTNFRIREILPFVCVTITFDRFRLTGRSSFLSYNPADKHNLKLATHKVWGLHFMHFPHHLPFDLI
jgi:hypothetical protein